MDKMKRIIGFAIFEIIEIVLLVLGSFCSDVFFWIFLGLALAAVLFFLLVHWLEKRNKKLPEGEDGKLRQRLVKLGKQCNLLMSECETNTRFSDKQEMERRSRLQLPDFKVVSCKETKPDFGGNYMGQMEIAFCEDFSPETLNKIKTEHSKNKIVFKSISDDVYGDWWHLQLSPDLKTAVIHYGHIDPMCP